METNTKIKINQNNNSYIIDKPAPAHDRLDLNTLIERIKTNEKDDKINNVLIISSAISIIVLVGMIWIS